VAERDLQLTVDPSQAGERLDRLLADALGSRARAQRLIEAGAVTVDGRTRSKRHRMAAGEQVIVSRSEDNFKVADVRGSAPYSIAYEDQYLMVVDKPAGVVVHPARGHLQGTLAQALAGRAMAAGGEPERPGIVHRLDRDTSGLLVVARGEEVHRRLKAALSARRIEREYLALVEGRPPARSGTIDAPIGRDRRVRTRMSIDTDQPREARTHFELARALPDTTLLRVRLETGRTHQVRVHLAAIGHPLCGDPEYGTAGRLGLRRQFLHAARLAFDHPVTGARVDVSSPLPEDLERAHELAAVAPRDH
jgi:23S rRNA pseudouridine1911/1915/1917 synthase